MVLLEAVVHLLAQEHRAELAGDDAGSQAHLVVGDDAGKQAGEDADKQDGQDAGKDAHKAGSRFFYRFFKAFFENRRRGLARLPKLY